MIRRFRNDETPKVAVTVDLLTTGIDVPSIVNLVFLRRVNSRILYDQMIGRATRRCDAIGKETFRVFDAVRQYDAIQDFTEMKPVVVNPNLSFAQLLEEFLARENAAGRLETLKQKLKPSHQPILLHGHCHQKAFGAVSPIMDVLRLIPGAQPELIESSCCGMAGSFGYEASHYDVSMQMAELSLLPAVRKQPDAVVVADGTSCRHQIRDGAVREAVHVAVLLARQLA